MGSDQRPASAAGRPALLLDSHLAHALTDALRQVGFEADHVAHWRGGELRAVDDVTLLRAATHAGRVLVTRDTATVPSTAFALIGDGETLAGVLVVSSRIRASDIGTQRAAVVAALAHRPTLADWRDAAAYAARPAQI